MRDPGPTNDILLIGRRSAFWEIRGPLAKDSSAVKHSRLTKCWDASIFALAAKYHIEPRDVRCSF